MSKTEYVLWKGVLLEWVNATGFLVRNYENLNDTDIEDFYRGFKDQIKSTKIVSPDVVQFVNEFYPEFEVETDDDEIPTKEFIYIYSLFMHFSCLRFPDKSIQRICSNLTEKYQEYVKNFLNNVVKYSRFPRNLVQDAIEDVESFDALNTSMSSTKSGPSILKSDSQQTPRTARYLNERHIETMNLKAMLETERYERGYLEMQAKHNEEKLMRLDAEHKKSLSTINDLNKQISSLRDAIDSSERNGIDRVIKELRKKIEEKQTKIEDYIIDMNALKDSNALLEKKIKFAEKQIKTLSIEKANLYDDIDRFRSELDERDKTIMCINSRNKDLEELIKELRSEISPNKKMYESSSFDFLNASTSSAVDSSFSFPSEENMANAVIDVRLLDQQKQNQELTETLNQLTNKLSKIQNEANDVYVELSRSIGLSVDSLPDLDNILSESTNLVKETVKKNLETSSLLESKTVELESMIAERNALQQTVEGNIKSIESLNIEINGLKSGLSEAENKYQTFVVESKQKEKQVEEKVQELESALNGAKDEKESEFKRFASNINELQEKIDSAAREKEELTLRLTESQNEINSINQRLDQRAQEASDLEKVKSNLSDELETTLKILEEARGAVKASEAQLEQMSKEKNDYCEELRAAKAKVDELEKINSEIAESKQHLQVKMDELCTKETEYTTKLKNLSKDFEESNLKLKSQDSKIEILLAEKASLEDVISGIKLEQQSLEQKLLAEQELMASMKATAEREEEERKLEIEELKTEINSVNVELEAERSKYDREVEKLQLVIDSKETLLKENSSQFATEMQILESKIASITNEISECKIQKEEVELELKAKLESANEETAKQMEIKVELEQKVSLFSTEISSLTDSSEKLKEEISAITAEKDSLKRQITELNKTIDEQQQMQQKMEDESKESLKQIVVLQEELSALNKRVDELNAETSTKTEEISHLNAKIALQSSEHEQVLEEMKQNLEAKISEFIARETELNARIENLSSNLDDSKEKLKTQEIKIEVLMADKTKSEDRIINLIEEKKSLEQKLLTEKEKHLSLKISFEKDEEQRKTEIEELKSKLRSLDAELNGEKTKSLSENARLQEVIDEKESLLKEEALKFSSEIQTLEERVTIISSELATIKTQKEDIERELNAKLQSVNNEIAKQTEIKAELEEKISSVASELSSSNTLNDQLKAEIATITTEKNSLVTKVIELNRTIDEQQQLQTKTEKESKELLQQAHNLEIELKTLNETVEKVNAEKIERQKEIDELNEKLTSSAEQIEKLESSAKQFNEELMSLKEENKKIIDSASSKDQLNVLKAQATQMQKKHTEAVEQWETEKKQFIQDMKILRAKLSKERDTIVEKNKDHEKKISEVRHEFEEKLEKMKERMKTLYSEEMSKVKTKHEIELNDLSIENQRLTNKFAQFESRYEQSAIQLHAMNTKYLDLLKESEIMKSKLRNYENSAAFQSITSSSVPPSFIEKIRAGNGFKMEDEEGELFDNTYLDQMKFGERLSLSGRDSLTIDEIQRRNSMVPPHLRSSYMAQFQNQNFDENATKFTDDRRASTIDISMTSSTGDQKRGTLYKRPGPPTPSKNGGRLSLGGANGELPRGEILRESIGNKDNIPTSGKTTAKKSTPGKFRAIFSSAKIKDENVCTPDRTHVLNLKLGEFLKTSTPRRRLTQFFGEKYSETMSSMYAWDRSLSILQTTNVNTHDSRDILPNVTRDITKSILSPSSDSASEAIKPKTNRIKHRKSNGKKRRASHVFSSLKNHWRREKRMSAFAKGRKMSVGQSDAFKKSLRMVNATFSIQELTRTHSVIDESEIEREEIDAFHQEIDFHPSQMEFIDEAIDGNVNFEQLCGAKESEHPYVVEGASIPSKEFSITEASTSQTSITSDTQVFSESRNKEHNDTPASLNSMCSTLSTATNKTCFQSSSLDINRHKMPRIVTYKSQTQIDQKSNAAATDVFNEFLNLSKKFQILIVSLTFSLISLSLNWINEKYFQKD